MNISKFAWLRLLLCLLPFSVLVFACSGPNASTVQESANLRAQATGTTYYIDNRSGSGCSDSGAGSGVPWCSFTPANAKIFQPGDEILLARGATWVQTLTLHGAGTSWSNPIKLDAYGSGNRPIIRGNDQVGDRTVDVLDPTYWQVSNLEISHAEQGLNFIFSTLGHQGIRVDRVYVHDMVGGPNGIAIHFTTPRVGTLPPLPGADQWLARDLQVSNTEVGNTISYGLVFFAPATFPANTFQDITVQSNFFHDITAKSNVFFSSTNVDFFDNYMRNIATVGDAGGTTNMFLFLTKNVTIANNIVDGVPHTGSTDENAVDVEGKTDFTAFRGNYFANTAGVGIAFLMCPCPVPDRYGTDYNTNNEVTSNTFVANGTSVNDNAALWSLASTGLPTGSVPIRDNFYSEANGLTTGDFSGFTFSNNTSLAANDIYNAGFKFTDIQAQGQWTYTMWPGSGGAQNLTWDTVAERWGNATVGAVTRFGQLPPANSAHWSYREWTAPRNGTISIRGRVFKNDISGGNGVRVAVTKNNAIIWPSGGGTKTIAYNDRIGYDTNVDSLEVTTGDRISFAINNNNGSSADLTSWAPTVAYLPVTSAATLINAGFEAPVQNLYAYGPISGSSWLFGSQAGIQRNGSAWLIGGGANAPEGSQAAFVQDASGNSCLSQIIAGFTAGRSYSFTFSAAQRGNGQGGQIVSVFIDDGLVGRYTPASTSYADITTASLIPGVGSHKLTLCGTVPGDHTAFIDNLRIN